MSLALNPRPRNHPGFQDCSVNIAPHCIPCIDSPRWNTTLQTLVASYEAYEDLMKKSQEGKDFYADLESKAAKLLEKARAACQASEASRQQVLER